MPLSAGDKLGPYEILAPIGAGGMGEVWKALDSRLNRIVAIKQLKGQHTARFEQEARAIAALNHPNICQVYDVGPDYLVMEHVEGKPLSGPLRADEALRLALMIAGAVEEAHGKGILHRDLKPANILVTSKSAAKLLDFGLAKLMKDSAADATRTVEGTVLGTAAYMAPEQAEGKALDERSDIFSFGAVLYEMLSGARAFDGSSTARVLSAVLRDDPAPLQAPAELQRIVSKCLAKQPRDRFANMAEVRCALEQVVPRTAEKLPSIAVLPFANMSADKENEYFSDGLAEEILNLLARIPGLKVIARTSSFSFRGKEQDIRKIAETLGVSNVLEGSVRKSGNRIRVTAQLIQAADGTHLWSERYDRDMTDVFAVQDEIGQAISEALQVRLAPRARTVNVEAYQLYLKGMHHRNRLTPESLEKARECFEQALAIDPNYAMAHSSLSVYCYSLGVLGIKPQAEVAPLARSAARKALAIDPDNRDAHSVLGILAAAFDYDWQLAEQHFRRAMAAEPIPPMVRFRYAMYCLISQGRLEEAMEQSRRGFETDPVSIPLHYSMAWAASDANQYREAMEWVRRGQEIDASFYLFWFVLAIAQLRAGSPLEAVASFQRTVELAPWFEVSGWCLAAVYFQVGDREQSRKWTHKLDGPRRDEVGAAVYYAAAGEVDAMFAALDAACQARDTFIVTMIRSIPYFGPYHPDPRYQAVLAKMNLA